MPVEVKVTVTLGEVFFAVVVFLVAFVAVLPVGRSRTWTERLRHALFWGVVIGGAQLVRFTFDALSEPPISFVISAGGMVGLLILVIFGLNGARRHN